MEAINLCDFLERVTRAQKELTTSLPSRQLIGPLLYEGLPIILTREMLTQICEDNWLLISNWRVAPGYRAYKLVNLSYDPGRSIHVEKWQLLSQDPDKTENKISAPSESKESELKVNQQVSTFNSGASAFASLGLKAAQRLIIFDPAVLYALLKIETEMKTKPTRKIEMQNGSDDEDDLVPAQKVEPNKEDLLTKDLQKEQSPVVDREGLRARSIVDSLLENAAKKSATGVSETSVSRETSFRPQQNYNDRATRRPARELLRRSLARQGKIEVGAVVELRRTEPGVKIEKQTKS